MMITVLLFLCGAAISTVRGIFTTGGAATSPAEHISATSSAVGVLTNLYVFIFLIAALFCTLHLLHNRTITSLVGPLRLAVRQFIVVLKALALLSLVTVLLSSLGDQRLSQNLALFTWLALLPFGVLGVLIQTSAEELVFRGYIQSQLAARFAHPAIWIVLPSVGFAALHYDPSLPTQTAWIIVVWAGLLVPLLRI